jgi:hypothetical protein
MSRILLVTIKEFDEIHRLEARCFDPGEPDQFSETKWLDGLSLILGPETVAAMVGKGPYRIEVGEWITRWQEDLST